MHRNQVVVSSQLTLLREAACDLLVPLLLNLYGIELIFVRILKSIQYLIHEYYLFA